MINYESTQIAEKNYAIKAVLENETIEFVVCVGQSEDEIPELVEFTINQRNNPVVPQPTYQDKRKAEYPPITDYLDGIVKNDTSQIEKYIADCLAVKAKYPK
jgi:hypothetical protein